MFQKSSSVEITSKKLRMDLINQELMTYSKRLLRTLFVSLKVAELTQIY